MKVLLNGLQAGNRSGTGQYTANLARWLPGMAPDVEVTVLWPRQVPIPEGVSDPASWFLLRDSRSLLGRVVTDQFGMRGLQDRIDADLVHYPANIAAQFNRPDTIVTIHDLGFMRNPGWFRRDRALYYRLTAVRSVRHARRVIADSQATAADLQAKLGVREDRIDVIPLGVDSQFRPADEERRAAVRARYRLPERFFLYLGTIEPRKNLARVIAAWTRLAETCPLDLVIAGREGWKVGPIRAAAAGSTHTTRIHWIGFVEGADAAALYSCADALVWPSLWEGFGLPPLEAMACGTPVMTSNVSSLPEVTGDAAVLVDPGSVDAIAEGMARLATDTALREDLAQKGQARAATFAWKRTAELTLESYRAAVNE